MNATATKFRSRSGVARKKPLTARRGASLVIAAAAAAAVAIPAAAAASTGSSAVVGHVYVPVSLPAGATPAGITAN